MDEITTYTASVKVMRSHDYCHFEVVLGSTVPLDTAGVDAMRKEAARLADKAVEQYKTAKQHRQSQEFYSSHYEKEEATRIKNLPETERSPEDQATLKAWEDKQFHRSRRYDYEDDWQDYDHDEN